MTINAMIELALKAPKQNLNMINKNYLSEDLKSPIRDMMNGFYKIRYSRGNGKYAWTNLIIKHCTECNEISAVFCNDKNKIESTQCSSKCRLSFNQKQEEPILFEGKLYTIDDCSPYERRIYNNPINTHVNRIKLQRAYNQRPEVKEKNRLKKRKYDKTPKAIETRSKYYLANIVKMRIRALLDHAIKKTKAGKIKSVLKYGIDVKAIISSLNNQAKDLNMLPSKLAETHDIDHIIPMSSYDFNNSKDLINCNHYLNLRWLDSIENRSKGPRLRKQDIEVIKTLPKEIYPQSWNGNIPTNLK
jgi:hypothetical protein